MRRTLLLVFIDLGGGILFASCLTEKPLMTLGAGFVWLAAQERWLAASPVSASRGSAVCDGASGDVRRRPFGTAILAFALGALLFLGSQWHLDSVPLADSEGEVRELPGLVVAETVGKDSLTLDVRMKEGKVRAVFYDDSLPASAAEGSFLGRRVLLSGDLRKPCGARNPGGYDDLVYLRSCGIAMRLGGERLSVLPGGDPVLMAIGEIRCRGRRVLLRYLPEDRLALLEAVTLGSKEHLSEEQYDAFRENGTAHLLAVSGLHLGLLYGVLMLLMGKPYHKGWGLFTLILLLCYALLTGGQAPVMRAFIMVALHVAGRLFHRPYDAAVSASAAGILLLAHRPYLLFTAGFQCSFLAVFLLAFLFPLWERHLLMRIKEAWYRRFGLSGWSRAEGALQLIAPLWLLQFLLIPYSVFRFHYLCLGAFLANLPLTFLAEILVPLGLAAYLLAGPFGSTALFSGMVRCLGWLLAALEQCNGFTYREGAASFLLPAPPVYALMAFYGAFFFFGGEDCRIRRGRAEDGGRRIVALAMTGILALSLLCFAVTDPGFGRTTAVFVDVGQGSCLHLRSGHANVLIDGGGKEDYDVGKNTVAPYLLYRGIGKVDLAAVTHLDTDHYQGIVSLCRMGMVKQLGLYEGLRNREAEILAETGLSREQILWLSPGDVVSIGGIRLTVLAPLAELSDPNEDSLVLLAEGPFGRLLATGDIGIPAEELITQHIPASMFSCDVMWIPHHGSRNSSSEALIQSASPSVAVAQAGVRNRYGHPDGEVVARYEAAGARVYRSDVHGAVGFRRKGMIRKNGAILVQTMDP